MPHNSSAPYPSMEQSAGLASKTFPSRSSTAIPSDACSKRYWKSSLACAGNASVDMTTPESVLTLAFSGAKVQLSSSPKVDFSENRTLGDKVAVRRGGYYRWNFLMRPTQERQPWVS